MDRKWGREGMRGAAVVGSNTGLEYGKEKERLCWYWQQEECGNLEETFYLTYTYFSFQNVYHVYVIFVIMLYGCTRLILI